MRRRRFVVVVSAVLLPAVGASASLVRHRDVSLAEAVRAASMVVEADYQRETMDPAPLWLFRAVRALRGSVRPGTVLRVRPAPYSEGIIAQRVHERTGVMRSPIIARLPAARSSALHVGQRYCLLLVWAVRVSEEQRELDWELAVEGGHVASPCPDVRRLLRVGRAPR